MAESEPRIGCSIIAWSLTASVFAHGANLHSDRPGEVIGHIEHVEQRPIPHEQVPLPSLYVIVGTSATTIGPGSTIFHATGFGSVDLSTF